MRAMLIAVAVLAAVGCGPADERERDAAACPVATTDRVNVTARFEITGWEAEVDDWEAVEVLVQPETANKPAGQNDLVRYIDGRMEIGSFDELRSTRATVTLAFGRDSLAVVDTETVTLDRNCDLLVEIAQSGDDPPRIDDVRWIPRE